MTTNGATLVVSYAANSFNIKPLKISMGRLQPTLSDFSFVLRKEEEEEEAEQLVEDAKCECCGMSEECTPEYIGRVRGEFAGRWICGLCSEAVKGEMHKNGGGLRDALDAHMAICVRFNRLGRTHPALFQAEDMKQILRKSSLARAKSSSPRDRSNNKEGAITRSHSCIPSMTTQVSVDSAQ